MAKAKRKIKIGVARIVVFLILCATTVAVGLLFKAPIESALNKQTTSSTATLDQSGLTTYFVDVGQGDGLAVRFPDGKTMLVDAGPQKNADNLIAYLKSNFFKSGENTFDYLLLTHSDEDHCGGMAKVCEEFEIKKIFRPHIYSKYVKNEITYLDETNGDATGKTTCTTLIYYKTITAFMSETSNIVFTETEVMNTTHKIAGDGYNIDFYYPTSNYITQSQIGNAGTVVNNYSPIMVLNYNNKKIMLTGDISTAGEQMAISQNDLPDVDVLKVAHHGSATSTGELFLSHTKPEHSIICVGEGNKYGHPTSDVINRLTSVGSQIYRTDQNGNIVVNITSDQASTINIYFDTTGSSVYIRVEYLMCGIIVLSIYFCFGIKVKSK